MNLDSLCKIYINNFFELYPLFNFFSISYLTPFYINLPLFIFNILVIFGANAIFYPEFLIEKRIFDNNRNKIYYPLMKEYIKILISIGIAIILNLIMKLIIIISIQYKTKLQSFSNTDEKLRKEFIKKFNMKFLIRRIIALFLMFIISFSLFYYVVAFCRMYQKTQLNWIIGSIYGILAEWIILCPIYIFIISIVQYKWKEDWTYYMKRLFFFLKNNFNNIF